MLFPRTRKAGSVGWAARGWRVWLVIAACAASLGVVGVAAAGSAAVATGGRPCRCLRSRTTSSCPASTTPPGEPDASRSAGAASPRRRCRIPTTCGPLYAAGDEGQGVTIAIIDSFGNPNMASDLAELRHPDGPAAHVRRAGRRPAVRDADVPARLLERQDPGEVAAAQAATAPACRHATSGPWRPAWTSSGRTRSPPRPTSST